MKKNAILLIILSLMYACSIQDQENQDFNSSTSKTNSSRQISQAVNYSANSLVVKFANGVMEREKRFLRNYYGVIGYKLCSHCANTSIELWMFDEDIEIEPKKETINNPTGGPGFPTIPTGRVIEYAEFNYDLNLSSNTKTLNAYSSTNPVNNYQSYIKNSNDGITVAVFDTGINPSLGSLAFFPDKFLYNASGDGIAGVYSGWDFVNSDNNCFDDDPNLHGTAVTSIITRNLNNYNIPYQILPLKIANSNGRASYFNLLCSLNFALERKASILQMSLGWYNVVGNPVDNIFVNLVNQYPNSVIVCSAGNDGYDNDIKNHCPSGYPLNNIIAVASCNQMGSAISSWSNYGLHSVDFFAKGENINFLGNSIQGTSFAAPIVAAKVARVKYSSPFLTNAELILNLKNTGTPCNFSKPVKYNRIINP